jgi:hypothetical protein
MMPTKMQTLAQPRRRINASASPITPNQPNPLDPPPTALTAQPFLLESFAAVHGWLPGSPPPLVGDGSGSFPPLPWLPEWPPQLSPSPPPEGGVGGQELLPESLLPPSYVLPLPPLPPELDPPPPKPAAPVPASVPVTTLVLQTPTCPLVAVHACPDGHPLPPVSRHPVAHACEVRSQIRPESCAPQSESVAQPHVSFERHAAPAWEAEHACFAACVHCTHFFDVVSQDVPPLQSASVTH